MMNKLYIAINHLITKIILILTIILFIFTGISNYFINENENYVAKVNGEIINNTQIEQALQKEYKDMKLKLGDQYFMVVNNTKYMKQIRTQILSQLIDNILLNQYFKKIGLNINDNQIKNIIKKTPEFQINGKFNNEKYLNLIHNIGYTGNDYAEYIKQQLINQQIIKIFNNFGFIVPEESENIAKLLLQKRKVRLTKINLDKLKITQPFNKNELKEYYYKNKNNFIIPEQIKLNYITINTNLIKNQIKINNKDINNYYEKYKNNFTYPEKKNYSIIQLKTKKEANIILNQLKNGANFSQLAKNKSIDIISKNNGGQIGWIESENTIEDIKKANLIKIGQISNILKSSIGYIIIRLNNIQPKKIKLKNEVYLDIIDKIKYKKILDLYSILLKKINIAIHNENQSLMKISKITHLKIQKTNWFTYKNIPNTLNFKPIIESIFNKTFINKKIMLNKHPKIININKNQSFIIYITDYKPIHNESFKNIKYHIIKLIKHNKALQQAQLKIKELLLQCQQNACENVITSSKLYNNILYNITLTSENHPLVENIFSLPHPIKNKPIYSISKDNLNNPILITLYSIIPGILQKNDIKIFTQKIEESINSISFYSLLTKLRKNAKINIIST
ncbi:Peptidyl-prolyl cis-trans isomerase D [Serratia symbiotica]|nr:Peptidyl-prolyl cis-trans isomerase D [Serratia symbiotica]